MNTNRVASGGKIFPLPHIDRRYIARAVGGAIVMVGLGAIAVGTAAFLKQNMIPSLGAKVGLVVGGGVLAGLACSPFVLGFIFEKIDKRKLQKLNEQHVAEDRQACLEYLNKLPPTAVLDQVKLELQRADPEAVRKIARKVVEWRGLQLLEKDTITILKTPAGYRVLVNYSRNQSADQPQSYTMGSWQLTPIDSSWSFDFIESMLMGWIDKGLCNYTIQRKIIDFVPIATGVENTDAVVLSDKA